MSTVSQTPARERGVLIRGFAIPFVVVAGVIALALGPSLGPISRMAAAATPHAPNLGLLANLSPAVKIHLATALLALVLGGVLMGVRKGRTFHRVAGWMWVSLVSVTAGVTIFITDLNNGSWSLLHLFTGWTLIILPLAVFWARRRNIKQHRRNMMGLFYGGFAINLFIAFLPGRTLWMVFLG